MNELQEHINEDVEGRVKKIEDHIETWNREMGEVKANTDWLIWGFRWLIAGIGGTLFITLVNVAIQLLK